MKGENRGLLIVSRGRDLSLHIANELIVTNPYKMITHGFSKFK